MQRQWITALYTVNVQAPSSRVAPLNLTRGEEVEAVYETIDGVLTDCWRLLAAMWPHRVRIALGIGKVLTQVDSGNALMMDGPAFHAARALLPVIRRTRADIGLAADGGINFDYENDVLRLMTRNTRTWKPARWNIMEYLRQGVSVTETARRLDLSVVAIYKNIDAGLIRTILRLTDELEASVRAKTGEP